MEDLNAVIARLEKVEKENRRLKRAGITCLLVAACVVLMGQARPSRTLEAERFVLKDASGRVRAELFTHSVSGVAMLRFLNERGDAFVSADGLFLLDSNVKNFAVLNLSRTGLSITDGKGTGIVLGGHDWEHPDKLRAGIVLSDKEGKVFWSAP
jgi:hypothetical protein